MRFHHRGKKSDEEEEPKDNEIFDPELLAYLLERLNFVMSWASFQFLSFAVCLKKDHSLPHDTQIAESIAGDVTYV
jgi:hypothetical protein